MAAAPASGLAQGPAVALALGLVPEGSAGVPELDLALALELASALASGWVVARVPGRERARLRTAER